MKERISFAVASEEYGLELLSVKEVIRMRQEYRCGLMVGGVGVMGVEHVPEVS